MKILVVGAGGVGASFAPIAARRDFYEHIVFADYDEGRARSVVDRYDGGRDRFSAARVDASDTSAIAALCTQQGITHVLNAVDPRFVMPIFDGALEAGVTYLDMAMSLSHAHADKPYELPGEKLGDAQFAKAGDWEAMGQLALVGIGVEPGLSDVFARYAQDHLFSKIDEGYRRRVGSENSFVTVSAQVEYRNPGAGPQVVLALNLDSRQLSGQAAESVAGSRTASNINAMARRVGYEIARQIGELARRNNWPSAPH